MQLGKTIVKIRKEYELTQEDFAQKFNVTRHGPVIIGLN